MFGEIKGKLVHVAGHNFRTVPPTDLVLKDTVYNTTEPCVLYLSGTTHRVYYW